MADLRLEAQCLAPASDAPLFLSQQGIMTLAQWQQRVADWQSALKATSVKRLAVYHENLAEFSAIVFAAWSQGIVCCVPGASNPGTVNALNTQVDAFAGQFSGLPEGAEKPLLSATENSADFSCSPLDYQRELLEIFTSGSSGEPKAIPKSLRQMSAEVTALEALWGEQVQQTCAIATVSHHHIYGMLFRMLWPLASGRTMWAETCPFTEDISAALPIGGDCYVISSPTHLSRLPNNFDWQALRKHTRVVFSSGAPLPQDASFAAAEAFASSVNEILGSSETGGMAWRRQHDADFSRWTPMPGILIRQNPDDQCLQIQSPFLADKFTPGAGNAWYNTTDRIELINDASFRLLGRIDRIEKVEGKRLSLSAMDQQLSAHPLIRDARSLVLKAHRTEVAAVLELSDAGADFVADQGRKPLLAELKNHLLNYFERPLLPRRWRIVLAIPRNSQGKTLQQDLINLFHLQSAGQDACTPAQQPARPQHPLILAEFSRDGQLSLDMQVPANLHYFDGHFDEHPILPGVAQLDWVAKYAESYLGIRGSFCGMKNVKFVNAILPGDSVTLSLSVKQRAESDDVVFRYFQNKGGKGQKGEVTNASGVICFTPARPSEHNQHQPENLNLKD